MTRRQREVALVLGGRYVQCMLVVISRFASLKPRPNEDLLLVNVSMAPGGMKQYRFRIIDAVVEQHIAIHNAA